MLTSKNPPHKLLEFLETFLNILLPSSRGAELLKTLSEQLVNLGRRETFNIMVDILLKPIDESNMFMQTTNLSYEGFPISKQLIKDETKLMGSQARLVKCLEK